jgi:ABC-type branched-subunit amino acid transport system substrate-binding protein
MVLPLSAGAPIGAVAMALKQAGELAILELDDPRIRLVVEDDTGTPEGAVAAATAATRDGAQIILGPLLSASVRAATPVTRAARVPMIAFSNDRQAQGAGVWLIGFQPEAEVERVISYAVAQGRRRIAAFIGNDAYGQIVEAALTRVAARLQANIVVLERYQGQTSQMLEPMRRIADEIRRAEAEGQPIDALFLPGGAELLGSLGPIVAYAGIDPQKVKLLGTSGWDEPNLGRDATFVGGWFPAPDPKSITVSPFLICANSVGIPHPRPKSASGL